MNRVLFRVFALAASLSAAAPTSGCKAEPPPPDEASFESLREKLDATKKDIAEAHRKMKDAADRARAERLAKQRAAASGDASPSDDDAPPTTPETAPKPAGE